MHQKSLLAVLLALALAAMACGIEINIPATQIKTGPTQTDPISVSLPSDEEGVTNVELDFGAGNLNLQPGAETALISGTATYNVADFKPVVTVDKDNVRISQGDLKVGGIPSFQGNVKNTWDLQFAATPINLAIRAGAYVGNYELGDLSLQKLTVSDGAADVTLSFSKPNRVEMETFTYETGASSVTITGLANANVSQVTFKGGAGTYTLDFSGELKQDVTVSIEAGISTVTLTVPENVSAIVIFDGGLSDVNYSGGWKHTEGKYMHSGSGPTITITVKTGAGNLLLETK